MLMDDYKNNKELTAFTAIDGDPCLMKIKMGEIWKVALSG